ncbi:MAG TPA: UDP-N-acetylmuramoyl-tripeptide--D-alanyl-D-alanine ligase [Nitrospirae bacterium]|nr:UDP-N-acetylmuramoyl-tripeptide--D-alanyl-D-alanine ligase [bacterium BMS3Abin10]GBE40021.1 UDP-N-acetylmuramoyl-tripeptide--D-alanyl-D-alanine ligase [bacterium BMS3Bbin08]HDH51770.1 UDP-N-acetylmuramoyl-tripeptide--D-alanyl-D-alanine ligase [Nitrospirota bacterium]HDK16889.1 UDP-N-acetylmuramoyl-tripeptide--D-alanyl-D-alanine ligase [Nitrospirota bacterium]HDK41461.1 UDP-N-acetylmuramoyl-tripeptide--D-alanyl-D-alanine ligase [Nitrospirota bacterium]
MATITTEEIIKATGGELLSENTGSFKGASIDSRTISEGEIFFAIKGPRFDGHNFLEDAFSKAGGAVIDTRGRQLPEGKVVIYVKDTLKALQDLAHFMRMRRDIPVIAITGSNGKTTTREMAYTILSKRFKVLKNEGNLNNHIGLPLSLTRLGPDDEAAVLELGMNTRGEIRMLCDIAAPSHGIVTNIGSAHIGNLGGVDVIRDEKLEILKGLQVAVLNADDDFLMEGYNTAAERGGTDGELITFSIRNDSSVKAENVTATDLGSSFTLKLKSGESAVITLNTNGLFNVYNALAASAVCISLGMTVEEIESALKDYRAFPMRFEVMKVDQITLINDSYNANPSSAVESVRELVRMGRGARTVAVMGDMLEMGAFSEKAHRSLGKTVIDMGVDVFVAVGEMMALAAEEAGKPRDRGAKVRHATYEFRTTEEAGRNIAGIIKAGDVVLVKGSRSMSMEKIIEEMTGGNAI